MHRSDEDIHYGNKADAHLQGGLNGLRGIFSTARGLHAVVLMPRNIVSTVKDSRTYLLDCIGKELLVRWGRPIRTNKLSDHNVVRISWNNWEARALCCAMTCHFQCHKCTSYRHATEFFSSCQTADLANWTDCRQLRPTFTVRKDKTDRVVTFSANKCWQVVGVDRYTAVARIPEGTILLLMLIFIISTVIIIALVVP